MKIYKILPTLLLLVCAAAAQAAERNVILFITDDQGIDSIGAYGNPVIKTPNQDRLAAEGTRFTHAFCTTASCSASRSVILTGLHNHKNGQYGHTHAYHHFKMFDNITPFPNYLAEAGYRTARVGKFHVEPAENFDFDEVFRASSRNPVQMADAAKDFITADSDEPFFLLFATSDPHRGGGVDRNNPYKPDRFGNRPQARAGLKKIEYSPDEVIVPPFLPDTPECRAELAEYYESVSRIDQGLGHLMKILEDSGQLDKTLIIYISDHGIAMPGAKTTTYEPGMRSPCLIRNPYLEKKGVVSDAMVSWVDLAPTILDFAGALKPEHKFHGRSFLPIMDQEHAEGWDRVYGSHTFHEIQMYYPMRVVRNRDYKLIWNIAHDLSFPFASDLWVAPTWQAQYKKGMDANYGVRTVGEYIHRPEFELFRVASDPWESTNLADSAEHQEILKELKTQLKQFQKDTEDPWIVKWQYE